MVAILYLSKVMIGGWASFTAHLSLTTGWKIYRLCKREERCERPFGWNCSYRNISTLPAEPIIISALGKHYVPHLKGLPDGTTIVIHDPTELKPSVWEEIQRFRVIVIRESMLAHIPNAVFMRHPFYPFFPTDFPFQFLKTEKPQRPVSVSRIDWDKNIGILVEANAMGAGIEIWGSVNRLYIHHAGLDMGASYKGRFAKTFGAISQILSGATHAIDLSTICRDGGGSQYTFLEAIYHGVPLILHKKWVEHPKSIFKDGVNCRAVSNALELVQALKMPPLLATELLEPHLSVSWLSLFPADER